MASVVGYFSHTFLAVTLHPEIGMLPYNDRVAPGLKGTSRKPGFEEKGNRLSRTDLECIPELVSK